MDRVAITGARGFLGSHTRAVLQESAVESSPIAVGSGFDLDLATSVVNTASRAIHLAGVNRASDDDVLQGNILFAQQLAEALRRCDEPPPVVVYANSVQASNGSAYGTGKARAGQILSAVASEIGATFVDLQLPNLFGEHGRPFYNAVTSTFCHLLANGEKPTVEADRELTLLHAQNAAELLVGTADAGSLGALSARATVSELLDRLTVIAAVYSCGEIPDVSTTFDRDLFNTYRSYTIDTSTPFSLTRNADERGAFFEIVRSHGGTGQSSFSTTAPGITRGNHFHRRKIERFTVVSGRARISMRCLFSNEVRVFDVEGAEPVAVDMPTLWAHNITNTGDETLHTSFWTDDIFDPSRPDTIAEVV